MKSNLRTAGIVSVIVLFCAAVWALRVPILLPALLIVETVLWLNEPSGFIDRTGKIVIDLRKFERARYDNWTFSRFSDGFCLVSKPYNSGNHSTRQEYVFMRPDGSFLDSPAKFFRGSDFSEGLAAVDVKKRAIFPFESSDSIREYFTGECSYIDKAGKLRFGPFAAVQNFSEGLAAVQPKYQSSWQFIDKSGVVRIKGPYSAATSFCNGRAAACVNRKWGLIDKDGKEILKPRYSHKIHPFCDGLAAVYVPESNRVDYLNVDGAVQLSVARGKTPQLPIRSIDKNTSWYDAQNDLSNIFPLPDDANIDASEALIAIEQNGLFGYGDLAGRTIVVPQYHYCWPFVEGRARVFRMNSGKGRFGFIDRTGKEVIPCKYFEASDFSEGLAVVSPNGDDQREYLDLSGKNAFGRTYPLAKSFSQGKAFVGRPPSPMP